ncbi:sulfurtransferase TusA family protein [Roseospirillum parvum]|uniref:TusA-related sulfurtransferase n=1 Tax=Roseospirillum parvum TaxID=83401 RepID=A0A1G8DN11_9PROT|nr:sulfurtransferase TusA family protein [Roseospirillum parvum]SDH59048.1 TusA-related sulfurtransferase [Roseospirillum parvum]
MNHDKPDQSQADYFLDITSDVCPMTYVRTRLLLEQMIPGQIAEIRLMGAEPLANVPIAVHDAGHEVLDLAPEPDSGADGPHRLTVRRGNSA